ncbi:MFS transporter [Oscillospiraceae bacterium PP1C4]
MHLLSEKLKKFTTDPNLLMVIFFAFFINGLMSTLLGTILPYMKAEYNISYALSGMLLSAHQVGNLAACIVAGFLPYLLGRKKSTLFLSTGTLIGMLLMTVTGNPLLLVAAFAFVGIGRGSTSVTSNVVVSEITLNKTKSLNILHATFAVGALLSPFLVIFLTGTLGITWRITPWAIFLLALIMLFVLGRSSLSDTPPSPNTSKGEKGFFYSFRFWLCTGILFFYLCAEATAIGWLVTYFKDSGIMSTTLAQSTSAILWVMILIGRLLCASFAGRINQSKLLIVMAVAMSAFYVLMISTRDIRIIFPALMGLGISMAGLYPTTLSCMDPRFVSSTAAMGTCVSTASFGAITMPIIVGIIAERTTIEGGMAAISVALVVLVILTVVNSVVSKPA